MTQVLTTNQYTIGETANKELITQDFNTEGEKIKI